MKKTSDFLVIGSGIAGLSFAIKAAKYGSVVIITKKRITNQIPITLRAASHQFLIRRTALHYIGGIRSQPERGSVMKTLFRSS